MIAAKSPAKTMPANKGLVNIERKTEAASSGSAKGSTLPSKTAARITIPMDTHSKAAMA